VRVAAGALARCLINNADQRAKEWHRARRQGVAVSAVGYAEAAMWWSAGEGAGVVYSGIQPNDADAGAGLADVVAGIADYRIRRLDELLLSHRRHSAVVA
jgi:hypothetical protein